jgi:short-subunit dehydrogenase
MIRPEKYALVTGASSGIGRHISEELAMRGYCTKVIM